MGDKTLRVDKLLSNMGMGSRTDIRKMVRQGLIVADGKVVSDPGMHVDPDKTPLMVDGREVGYKRYFYFMLNKPQGILSATSDSSQRTVLNLFPDNCQNRGLYPVGRLDRDTEGLLIVTNDGPMGHRLLAPKNHVSKVYFAQVQGEVGVEDEKAFLEGILLEDGYVTMPAKLTILRSEPVSQVLVEICEGKYHQIKRMFAARQKHVAYLKRLKMGDLTLDENLKPGEYRELTGEEIALLGGTLDE